MAERIINGYKGLFEIRLLHHYWLDEGATVFDLIPEEKKVQRLLAYDRRSFLEVAPTAATAKILSGLGGVYKDTALGCMVVVPDTAVILGDVVFEFVVTVKNQAFYNYSALTLRPRRISYHQLADKTYRYKENVPVLSNLTGAAREKGSNRTLFLSKEFPASLSDDQVESLVLLDDGTLAQLIGAGTAEKIYAKAETEAEVKATDLPVFVHQDDIPIIIPPPGLVDVPKRGIALTGDIPDSVFALIRLSPIRTDDEDFNFTDSSGYAKATHPVFQVRFKNRSAVWTYIYNGNGNMEFTEPKPLPLTFFGNAGTKQKPSQGLVKVAKSGSKVTQLISEIYV
jgi:hypothetical protein